MAPTPLRPGDPVQLGRYRMSARLGEGGMGAVYLAGGPDGRPVAVKVIRPEFAHDPEFLRRFRNEVDRARQVPPFCTAGVVDADPDHATPYLVVEYVDGPTLADVVRDAGPLADGALFSVAVGVATALVAIHGAGVVHRDLKPANVLFGIGTPKVIDFGIARTLDGGGGLTHPDQMVGTLAYMAPERLDAGAGDHAGPAADVFAWGVVVAYAATGSTPFGTDSPMATIGRILTQPPDLRGLSGPLLELVTAALSKEPADRPTALDLLNRLLTAGRDRNDGLERRPALREAARAAQRTGRVAARRRRRRRSRALAGGVAALVLLTGASVAVARQQSAEAREQRAVALSRQFAMRSRLDQTITRADAARLAAAALTLSPADPASNEAAAANLSDYRGVLPLRAVAETLTFGPSGDTLTSVAVDGEAQTWDLRTGRLVRSFTMVAPGRDGSVLSADGRWLAASDYAERVVFRDLRSGSSVAIRHGAGPGVNVELSADGRLAAVHGTEGDVRIVRRDTGTVTRVHDGPTPRGVRFSPDGRWLAMTDDTRVRLWDTATGKPRTGPTLPIAKYSEGLLVFAPDGITLAAESRENVELWNVRTGETRRVALPAGPGGQLGSMAFSPDGQRLATATGDATVRLWDVRTGRLVDAARPLPATYQQASPDLRSYLAPDGKGLLRGYRIDSGRAIGAGVRGLPEQYAISAIDPDGRLVARNRGWGVIEVADLRSGRRVGISPVGPAAVGTIAFRPRHRQIAITQQGERRVLMWTLGARAFDRVELTPSGGAGRLAFDSGGEFLAISEDENLGGDPASFRIFEVATGQPIGAAFAMGSAVSNIAFSRDGRLVAATGNDGRTRVWNRTSGELVTEVIDARIFAFSPDGHHIATAGRDNRVRIRNSVDGGQIGAPIDVGGYPSRIVFEGGTRLRTLDHRPVAGLETSRLQVWDLSLYADPLRSLCSRTGSLTADGDLPAVC